MSSWDRSRFIPWTRLQDVSGPNYEQQKEGVFRSLQREAVLEEKQFLNHTVSSQINNNNDDFVPSEIAELESTKKKQEGLFNSGVPYTTPDFIKSLAFGGCIGSITGAVFGFMDGMRSASESTVLKNASNMAKSRYLLQGTTRSATLFGLFFSGFHAVKYGIRVASDPGDAIEIGVAGAASLGVLMLKPVGRASIPYAGMLIGMDAFSNYMKKHS